MTPVSLFLSSAGASLTIISSDRLGARPATWPGRRIVGCHLGHDWSGGGGGGWGVGVASGWTMASAPVKSAKWPQRTQGKEPRSHAGCNRGVIAQ